MNMMDTEKLTLLYKQLPKVDGLLEQLPADVLDRAMLKDLCNQVLDQRRKQIAEGAVQTVDSNEILQEIREQMDRMFEYSLKRVINATGVMLHTNLGRAVLSIPCVEHLKDVLCYYNNLEYDLAQQDADVFKVGRGDRNMHVRALLQRLTGKEAAIVVNNNAAAVMLVLNEFAQGQHVIVSRGEQVEIGGSFRIPEVAKLSGARICEVGTTNVSRIADYERAMTADTAMILRVEPSNFSVIGQTSRPTNEELYAIARERNIPYYVDLGSGTLFSIAGKQALQEVHADMISFSGDKILGAGQAGIIVGRQEDIMRLKKNPLYRAFRADKTVMAILEHVLMSYLSKEEALQEIPVIRMLTEEVEQVKSRAMKVLKSPRLSVYHLELKPTKAVLGGGSSATYECDSYAISINAGTRASAITSSMRSLDVPIVATIAKGEVILDFKTIFEEDIPFIIDALVKILDFHKK